MKKVLISWLAFAACIVSADHLPGLYVLHGVMEVGSELLLKPDGSFEYMLAYGAADYSAKGTWRRDQDFVVLNTSGKEASPFRLLRSTASKAPGVRVWVKAPNGQGVPNIEVALGTSGQRTTAEGEANFPEAHSPRSVILRVPVYSLEWGPFEVISAHNDFYFEINPDAITQVRFKNERLKIDGKTLDLRFWDKDKPMLYERQ